MNELIIQWTSSENLHGLAALVVAHMLCQPASSSFARCSSLSKTHNSRSRCLLYFPLFVIMFEMSRWRCEIKIKEKLITSDNFTSLARQWSDVIINVNAKLWRAIWIASNLSFFSFPLDKAWKISKSRLSHFEVMFVMNPNALINSTRPNITLLPVFRLCRHIKTGRSFDIKNLSREIEIQLRWREDARTIVFHLI